MHRILALMLGALLTLAFCLAWSGLGYRALDRWTKALDPAERFGLSGMFALGPLGVLTFFVGLIPGGFRIGMVVLVIGFLCGLACWFFGPKLDLSLAFPKGARMLFPAAILLFAAMPLVGVLAPSDMLDWDGLAYHLAVPKVWLEAGQMQFLPYDHHSNFPLAVDNLFIWGESWGGQHGAKAFVWAYFLLGVVALFGIARRWYGKDAGWWAALTFCGVPLVLWESGTAYIDVSSGLFAGLGLLYVAEFMQTRNRALIPLSTLALGLAAGSKYTGLQMVVVAIAVLLILQILHRKRAASACDGPSLWTAGLTIAIGSLLIASPWYIRNIVTTGNPVYPFLYERFGSSNWDQWRAELYRDEQQSFGVGRFGAGRDLSSIGGAILGLGYQPGRYVNPMQDQGAGLPIGATGVAILCAGLLWLISGAARLREGSILLGIGLSLVIWFFLSQQSRYILSLAPPLAVLAGGAATVLSLKRIMMGVAASQAVYCCWLVKTTLLDHQLPVVLGQVSTSEYLSSRVGFFEPSRSINERANGGKVALYDEVFGYLLEVPYFWANPGHSTQIPYEKLELGSAYAEEMRRQGFTHVYVNLAMQPEDVRNRWLEAAGLAGEQKPYSADERKSMSADLNWKWKLLLAEAIATGDLRVAETYKGSILFEIAQPNAPN